MLQDLRFALRLLTKNPGFTLVAVLALGVGIGLSTAVFNAFSAILLRPVPYFQDEERIVFIDGYYLKNPENGLAISQPDLEELRLQSRTLTGFSTYQNKTVIFGGDKIPERVLGTDVSAAAFPMFGVQPLHGRLFTPADARPGAQPVTLLSHGLWQRRFGGREDVLNRAVVLNGATHLIVGIMPPGFRFPENSELWTPMTEKPADPAERGKFSWPVYARINPGVTLDEARAELAAIAGRLATTFKATNADVGFRVRPVREEAAAEIVTLTNLMLGAVLCVLLIACANVANLLLAKSAARAHEIAIRTAIGATRGRILRQVFTESLLLGLLGGAAGLIIGVWTNSLILHAIPSEHIPFWMVFDFDWRVFGFSAALAVLSSVLFGLFPALQVSRSTAAELKEGARGGTGGPRAQRLRHVLVVSQVALALVLLIGAGLMVRSFIKLRTADFGYDPTNVLTFRVGVPQSTPAVKTEEGKQIPRQFFRDLDARLKELPGVEAAGAISILPGVDMSINAFAIEGREKPASLMDMPFAVSRFTTPGYFRAMGIPLLRGRDFTADDRLGAPRVVIVDQGFVDRWFPGEDVIGKRLSFASEAHDSQAPAWSTIIGVVGTVPQFLGEKTPKWGVYRPVDQDDFFFLSFAVRAAGDPMALRNAIQQTVLKVRADIPIYNVLPMTLVQRRTHWDSEFFSMLFSAFGLSALFLASLGIYGVMSFAVAQRTPEIGVRMALGAQPGEVQRMVSRQGLWLVGLGMILGLAAALGLTRLMAGLLYGVSPNDPPTYFALSLVLAFVGFLSCWLPARRATRIDPMVALRAE